MAAKQNGKHKARNNQITLFGVLLFSMIFILVLSASCFVLCCIPKESVSLIASPISTATEPTIPTEDMPASDGDAIIFDIFELEELPDGLKSYADVIIGVTISISVALISITATIFIFSKSALDRINDENEYVADVVNIHKKENIKQLVGICIVSVLLIILPLMWHLFFSFAPLHMHICRIVGLFALVVASILYFIISCVYWYRCICVEESLQEIIVIECSKLKDNLNILLPNDNEKERLRIIGDWISWEDEHGTSYEDEGTDLCDKMTADQFINLFQKAEKLLLSGDSHPSESSVGSNIITILQERMDILVPSTKVEKADLENRYYGSILGNDKINDTIRRFEQKIGFGVGNNSNQFFSQTEALYTLLKKYRNLLISERYTQTKVSNRSRKRMENSINFPEKKESSVLFSQALYYFFLRVIAVFVSSVRIANFSLNGCSLNYANFYGSTLQDITLYSSIFFRTILSRTSFSHVIMDISMLCDIDFYCTRISDSSFNNCTLENVDFERTTIQNAGFDSCIFNSCQFLDNDIISCNFNNSEIENTAFFSTNFSHGKFRDVQWKDCSIEDCSFQDSDIQKWSAYSKFSLLNCDFSRSIWRNMNIDDWILIGGIFMDADLTSVKIIDTDLSSSSFLRCCLAAASLEKCNLSRVALQQASLFEATLSDVNMSTADLSGINAVKSKFTKCNLSNSNCADGDFSEAQIEFTDLTAARLYDCAMTGSQIKSSSCRNLLADHLQFTFAMCENSNFSYSSLAETNMTKSKFYSCTFNGSDLTGMNATSTMFEDCEMDGVDFSESRFVETCFRGGGNPDSFRIIKNCDFTACKFEKVIFENIKFVGCIFDNAIFIDCSLQRTKHTHLTKFNFKKLSNTSSNSIKWFST